MVPFLILACSVTLAGWIAVAAPSPDEIAAECERIRATWPEGEEAPG